MTDSRSQELANKSNPWLGFVLLVPLTLVLFAISRTGLDGAVRAITIMGIALFQAAIAARVLLGAQKLHSGLKALLLLIALITFLMLLMPTWQLFEGTAVPATQWSEETPEEAGP